jgi:hypothetical protein
MQEPGWHQQPANKNRGQSLLQVSASEYIFGLIQAV